MIASMSEVARAVGEFCLAVIVIFAWIAGTVVVVVVVPIALFAWFHRRDALRTEGVIRSSAVTVWGTFDGASAVLLTGANRCWRAAGRVSDIAAHGRNKVFMAILGPVCLIGLAIAMRFGAATEAKTLELAGNGPEVIAWMTFAVFATGAVGGFLILEAMGATHFLARATAVDDNGAPIEAGATEDPPHSRVGRFFRRVFPRRGFLFGAALCALLILAVPAYAITTGATSRAAATVRDDRRHLADQGALCDPETAEVSDTDVAPGRKKISTNRATAECERLAVSYFQNENWGFAVAAGMALLDIVAGWLAMLGLVWVGAMVVVIAAAVLRLLSGIAKTIANFIDRVVRLVLELVRLGVSALPGGTTPPTAPTTGAPIDPLGQTQETPSSPGVDEQPPNASPVPPPPPAGGGNGPETDEPWTVPPPPGADSVWNPFS